MCDGTMDCDDGEDEQNCNCADPTPFTCPTGGNLYMCINSGVYWVRLYPKNFSIEGVILKLLYYIWTSIWIFKGSNIYLYLKPESPNGSKNFYVLFIDTACGVSCDGTKDCDNGEDEQDNCTCDDPALPFKCTSGGIYWDH